MQIDVCILFTNVIFLYTNSCVCVFRVDETENKTQSLRPTYTFFWRTSGPIPQLDHHSENKTTATLFFSYNTEKVYKFRLESAPNNSLLVERVVSPIIRSRLLNGDKRQIRLPFFEDGQHLSLFTASIDIPISTDEQINDIGDPSLLPLVRTDSSYPSEAPIAYMDMPQLHPINVDPYSGRFHFSFTSIEGGKVTSHIVVFGL